MYIPKHAKLSPTETIFVIMNQSLIMHIPTCVTKKTKQIQASMTKLIDTWDVFLEKISKELEKEKLRWLIRIKIVQIKLNSLKKSTLKKITSLQR